MRKRLSNKARVWGGLGALAVCLAAVGAGLFLAARPGVQTAARINGLDVDVREYLLVAGQERGGVLADFTARYGAQADEGFWQREWDGETPAQALEKRTLDRLTVVKVQQQMMLEAGVLEDAGYEAFLEDWRRENQRRRQALERGEALYGPESYTEEQYYTLRLDKGLLALADKLAAGELKVTDEERQAAYQRTDAFLFEEDGTRKPLEEVRAVLDKRLVEEKFEKKTAALAAKAAVTVHRDTLDKVRYN